MSDYISLTNEFHLTLTALRNALTSGLSQIVAVSMHGLSNVTILQPLIETLWTIHNASSTDVLNVINFDAASPRLERLIWPSSMTHAYVFMDVPGETFEIADVDRTLLSAAVVAVDPS